MRASCTIALASGLALILGLGGPIGCASSTTTVVKTETTTEPVAAEDVYASNTYEDGSAPEPARTTVTTTTTKEDQPTGIVGSAVNLGGAVIAFPFRVIGATLGAIF